MIKRNSFRCSCCNDRKDLEEHIFLIWTLDVDSPLYDSDAAVCKDCNKKIEESGLKTIYAYLQATKDPLSWR